MAKALGGSGGPQLQYLLIELYHSEIADLDGHRRSELKLEEMIQLMQHAKAPHMTLGQDVEA